MSHWLEEAENRKKSIESDSAVDKVKKKKKAIRENYDANREYYDRFVKNLESLALRINDLPKEYREDYGKVNFNFKDSKLDNQLFYLSTSRRIQKRLYRSLLTYFKKYTFKHIRVAYFSVSKEMGMVDIELKENHLLRIKIKSNGDDKHRKLPKKDKNARKDYVFRLKLEQVNENTAIQIIDWIVFRKEMEEISFFNEKLHSL